LDKPSLARGPGPPVAPAPARPEPSGTVRDDDAVRRTLVERGDRESAPNIRSADFDRGSLGMRPPVGDERGRPGERDRERGPVRVLEGQLLSLREPPP